MLRKLAIILVLFICIEASYLNRSITPSGPGVDVLTTGSVFHSDSLPENQPWNATGHTSNRINSIGPVRQKLSIRQGISNDQGYQIFLPLVTAGHPGHNYFVAPNGNDANPGTIAQPWKTIQKAANAMAPGDIVYIRGGMYPERVIVNSHSGAIGAPITFTSYPGEIPVLEGTGISISGRGGLFEINNSHYIRIEGLTIQNSDDAGILATRSTHIEIVGNRTRYTHSSGVGVWTSDQILVSQNIVVNARYVDAPHGHQESITIATTTNFDVSYNDISLDGVPDYIGNEGIDCKDGARFGKVHDNYIHNYPEAGGTIYIDAWESLTSDIDIYSNYLDTTKQGIVIGSERGAIVQNIKIHHNLIVNNGFGGIIISITSGYDGLRKNIDIYNNTIYLTRGNGSAGIYIMEPNIDNIVIKNNIVFFNLWNGEILATSVNLLPHIKAINNLVYGPKKCGQNYPDCVELSDNPPGYSDIHGNITQDPLFTDPPRNFHPILASPACTGGEGGSLIGAFPCQ